MKPVNRSPAAGVTTPLKGAEAPAKSKATSSAPTAPANSYATPGAAGPTTIAPKEPNGVVPQGKLGFEAAPHRAEWAPFEETDPKAYHGGYQAGGIRSPRDVDYAKGVELLVPRRAIFEVVGLKNLERAGVPKAFDTEVTITRPDGSTRRLNLARAPDRSVPPEDFDLAMEEVLKLQTFTTDAALAKEYGVVAPPGATQVTFSGAQVVKGIDKLLDDAVKLSQKNPPEAEPPPDDTPAGRKEFLHMVRRFAVQTVWHTMGLTAMHVAKGYDPAKEPKMNEVLRHDLVEPVPLQDLAFELALRPHEPWMANWVRAEIEGQKPGLTKGLSDAQVSSLLLTKLLGRSPELDAQVKPLLEKSPVDATVRARLEQLGTQELTFNAAALNPHFLIAFFKWGDSREDSNVFMDPHRLSPHHNGNSTDPVDLELRADNGAWHHGKQEHMGVRHEAYQGFDKAEPGDMGNFIDVLKTDPAFKSPIVQKMSFEAAKFLRAMQEQGYVVPFQKLKVPAVKNFVQLDTAYQTLQDANRKAEDLFAKQSKALTAALPTASAPVQEEAKALLQDLQTLSPTADAAALAPQVASVQQRYEALLAEATGPGDKAAATALGLAISGRFNTLSARTVELTALLVPAAEQAEDALYAFDPTLKPKDGHLFLSKESAAQLREDLEGLSHAAAKATKGGDRATAQVYRDWEKVVRGGFASTSH